jgi:hypothetical protein
MSTPAVTPDQDSLVGNGQGALAPTDQSAPVQQAPDASQLPVGNRPTPSSADVTPAAPAPSSGGMFDHVLSALAGHPRQNYRVDPTSGKMQSDPVTSKASLAEHIVAAALVGMLKGASVKPGPASAMRAFGAGAEGSIEHNQQQTANDINGANAEFKRQQDITTQKATAVEQNLRQLALQQSLSKADLEAHQAHVGLYADTLDDIQQNSPDSVLGTKVIEAEAKDPKKYPLTAQRIPDGVVPMLNQDGSQVKDKNGVGQYENTFTIVDADAKTQLTDGDGKLSPWAETAQQWNIPAAKSYGQVGAGQQVSVIAANRVQNQVAALQITQDQINSVRKQQGLEPVDLKSMVKEKGQSLVDAVTQYHRVYQSADPNVDIAAMKANPQAAKYVSTMTSLFGADALQKDSEQRKIQAKNDEVKGTAQAEADAAALKKTSELNAENKANKLGGGGPVLTGQDYLKTLPPNVQSTVRGIAEGREGIAVLPRGKERQTYIDAINQAYPDWDESKTGAYQKMRNDFTSGKTSVGINSYNTAISHLGTMYDHVSGTNSLQINNPLSDVHRQLQLDNQLVSTELAKAVSNGQMTEGEKNQIMGSISGMTVGSYQTRIKEAVQLMNGKLEAYQQQWQNGMPTGVVTPVKIVSDQAQQTMNRISGQPSQPQTHSFSVSAWQKANPNGDVNAAKAAAQQQGYSVVN